MKRIIILTSIAVIVLLSFFSFIPKNVLSQTPDTSPYIPCNPWRNDDKGYLDSTEHQCPIGSPLENCASSYEEWKENPYMDFWVADPEVTALGKGGQRSLQFLYWNLTHSSIVTPVLSQIWSTSRMVAIILLTIVVAIIGVGIIVGKKYSFGFKIDVSSYLIKLILSVLYIFFSFLIVVTLIEISEYIMKFFTETLGVMDLFNIHFIPTTDSDKVLKTSEKGYTIFRGCSNLNIDAVESVKTSKFLVNITNLTYYLLGIMLILRKVILWFLLFVSPFLAILMQFTFIRNIGWIWIGVFFQWLMYGPLFSLFLGAVSKIWNSVNHIPYIFDFTRAKVQETLYPTATNLTYGGPAQTLGFGNTSSYIDTLAEYIISLIMLWAVVFFPWWLLRIFRDYCCDGIYAMKNILLSMYDQARSNKPPPTPPGLSQTPHTPSTTGTAMKIPTEQAVTAKVKLETVQEIKQARTEEIRKSMDLSVNKLTDIARVETNKTTNETVKRNLENLANPTKASTPQERQKFMNIRTELFNRAIKKDVAAKQMLSSISSSKTEQIQKRDEIIKTIPQVQRQPVTNIISIKVKIPTEKVSSISSSLLNNISTNNNIINSVSQTSGAPPQQIQQVLMAFKRNIENNEKPEKIIENVSKKTNVQKENIIKILQAASKTVKENKAVKQEIAKQENINPEQVEKVLKEQVSVAILPGQNIEQTISIPPTVSIQDYEEVKKMWVKQYEKGEVPVTENIKTREEWVDTDIIFVTNTLNKLVATDNTLKQEGIDDLGYILPVFMINNLKGEEIVVYLKAKIEAAKTIKAQIEKEKEITNKLKDASKEEEFVDIKKQTKETPKTMEMKREMKIEDDKKDNKGTQNPNQQDMISDIQKQHDNKQENNKAQTNPQENKDEGSQSVV